MQRNLEAKVIEKYEQMNLATHCATGGYFISLISISLSLSLPAFSLSHRLSVSVSRPLMLSLSLPPSLSNLLLSSSPSYLHPLLLPHVFLSPHPPPLSGKCRARLADRHPGPVLAWCPWSRPCEAGLL